MRTGLVSPLERAFIVMINKFLFQNFSHDGPNGCENVIGGSHKVNHTRLLLFDRLCLFASSCSFAFSRDAKRTVVQLNLEIKRRHEERNFIKLERFYFEMKSKSNASRFIGEVCITLYKPLICKL